MACQKVNLISTPHVLRFFLPPARVATVFHAQPPTPPSAAQQATQSTHEQAPFFHSIKRLFLNWNYILLLISYGMNVGVFYAISTLLNRVGCPSLTRSPPTTITAIMDWLQLISRCFIMHTQINL